MTYDEFLVDRERQALNEKKTSFEEKKMMGGLYFMVNGKMCIGVDIDKTTGTSRIMARIGEDVYKQSLQKENYYEFNITGKAMKGFVFVAAQAIDMQVDLEYWIQLCLDYNPLTKSSKKKTTTNNVSYKK